MLVNNAQSKPEEVMAPLEIVAEEAMEAREGIVDEAMESRESVAEVAGVDASAASKQEENEEESKSEKFRRVAVPRVDKVIKSLELLGNLSKKSIYEYSDDEVAQIFDSITGTLETVRGKFTGKADCQGFHFK